MDITPEIEQNYTNEECKTKTNKTIKKKQFVHHLHPFETYYILLMCKNYLDRGLTGRILIRWSSRTIYKEIKMKRVPLSRLELLEQSTHCLENAEKWEKNFKKKEKWKLDARLVIRFGKSLNRDSLLFMYRHGSWPDNIEKPPTSHRCNCHKSFLLSFYQ